MTKEYDPFLEKIIGADTDVSPYDSGSYASSTTYITGQAVVKACGELKQRICAIAAKMLNCEEEAVVFERTQVRRINSEQAVSLTNIAYQSQVGNSISAESTATHSSPVSPPPYMVGMVEIELDKLTGKVDILDYMAVVDCGIPINPALARIQTEGGIVQGIGHTLIFEVSLLQAKQGLQNAKKLVRNTGRALLHTKRDTACAAHGS